MTVRTSLYAVLAVAALAVAAPRAAEAGVFLRVAGVKGAVLTKGHEGTIEARSFRHEVTSPRDSASGQSTGQRQHKPVTLQLELDQSAPQLRGLLFRNQKISEVVVEVWLVDARGVERKAYSLVLTNAYVAVCTVRYSDEGTVAEADDHPYLDVSFVYERLTETWHDNGSSASDTWLVPSVM